MPIHVLFVLGIGNGVVLCQLQHSILCFCQIWQSSVCEGVSKLMRGLRVPAMRHMQRFIKHASKMTIIQLFMFWCSEMPKVIFSWIFVESILALTLLCWQQSWLFLQWLLAIERCHSTVFLQFSLHGQWWAMTMGGSDCRLGILWPVSWDHFWCTNWMLSKVSP